MKRTDKAVGYAVKALVVLFLGLQPTFGAESSVPFELTIQGNGQAEYLAMAHQDALVITLQALPSAEGDEGNLLDWWLLASAPSGLSSYSMEVGAFAEGIHLLAQEPLLDQGESVTVWQAENLGPGDYFFHFGVDAHANGALDSSAWFESLHVHVVGRECVVRYESDFSHNADGWVGGFADYPMSVAPEDWQMAFAYEPLPVSLGLADANGLMLQGNNHSDDLFMYVKRQVAGLSPNTQYEVLFQVDLASNAASDSFGVGGSPGASVYVKVGASVVEPNTMPGDNDHWRMNIDKGNQSSSGADAITIGTIGVDLLGPGLGLEYKIKTLDNAIDPLSVTTDSQGRAWLLVGIDSGFESLTRVYMARFVVEFVPKN